MNKSGIKLGLAASTLSLMTFAPSAEAAGLNLRGDLLDTFFGYVQNEGQAFDELALPQLDAANLFWDGVDPVEVFFIDEGAGFKNQLLYSVNDQPLEMIFDNVSSTQSTLSDWDGALDLGEGRNLGTFDGPTQLSFFTRANGFNGGTNLFGANEYTSTTVEGETVNGDGLTHLIAYEYFDDVEQETYTIIGFEDLWGEKGATGGRNQNSDRDFNDVVFAVKGLTEGAPEEVPEPSMLLGMLGVAALGAKGAKRKLTAA